MDIHVGHLIEKEIRRRQLYENISMGYVAYLIGKSRSNLYDIFNRKVVDSNIITRLSIALDINFFDVLAKEVEERLREKAPKEIQTKDGLMCLCIHGNDRNIVYLDDNNQQYYLEEQIYIGLKINGSDYFDERIVLPSKMYPLLLLSYDRALAGPLKGLDHEEVGRQFFPWLDEHHPEQAYCIKKAVEDVILQSIAEDPCEEFYRSIVNYTEPSSADDWYAMTDDNEIEYWLDYLPERIHVEKKGYRPE